MQTVDPKQISTVSGWSPSDGVASRLTPMPPPGAYDVVQAVRDESGRPPARRRASGRCVEREGRHPGGFAKPLGWAGNARGRRPGRPSTAATRTRGISDPEVGWRMGSIWEYALADINSSFKRSAAACLHIAAGILSEFPRGPGGAVFLAGAAGPAFDAAGGKGGGKATGRGQPPEAGWQAVPRGADASRPAFRRLFGGDFVRMGRDMIDLFLEMEFLYLFSLQLLLVRPKTLLFFPNCTVKSGMPVAKRCKVRFDRHRDPPFCLCPGAGQAPGS